MKEAFWGTLIVILGLFGIVVVNIFQNVTVDNDRVYYLIKESTEAAAFDAIDLTTYRLNGSLRMVEEKFIENLTRRFAENITIGDYTIIVEDINELPPKISLRVRSGITSLQGEEFGIVNRVDGIIETKYSLDDVLDFLGITVEEWYERTKDFEYSNGEGENTCNAYNDTDEPECMNGNLKFMGFSNIDMQNAVCHDETPRSNVERNVNYKVCNCGKWEEKTEKVTANPIINGNEYIYTWKFSKTGEVLNIEEQITSRVKIQVCTTAIQEMVPNDIETRKPDSSGSSYEPSSDNSKYMVCPIEGIKVVKGVTFTMHPNYIPENSINRNLKWSVSDTSILGYQSSNPGSNCVLNSDNTNCLSKTVITAKKVGTSYVNVSTTRNQTATCKIEVISGYVDDIKCNDLTIDYNSYGQMTYNYSPSYAVYKDFKWSTSDTNIATIDEKTGEVRAKGPGTTTVTITAPGNKKGTCTLTVKANENVESVTCEDLELLQNTSGVMKRDYSPSNATKTDFKWSINNANIATINEKSGEVNALSAGTATVTITAPSGVSGTCKLNVKGTPSYSGGTETTTEQCSYEKTDEIIGIKYETEWVLENKRDESCGCEYKTGNTCQYYKICRVPVEIETPIDVKQDVIYNGYIIYRDSKRGCDASTGKAPVYRYKYCRIRRTSYYKNPGLVFEVPRGVPEFIGNVSC